MDAIGDAISGAADTVADTVGGAVAAVADVAEDLGIGAAIAIAKKEVLTHTGIDFEIKVDVPEAKSAQWKDWIRKTGINSICCDDTWDFLEKSSSNQPKVDKWEERKYNKIIMTVEDESTLDEWEVDWRVANVTYEKGSNEFYIKWCPRALNWDSDSTWADPTGSRRWWIIMNEIVFGLDLYELPGKCFYKSGWVDDFEDNDPNSCLPNGSTTYRRWLQFRHWSMLWYGKARAGWNYQWVSKPPKNPDGSLFDLNNLLDFPDVSLPKIEFPALPDIEMPTIEAPTIEAPTIEAPSLEAPSVELSAPSMDSRKVYPKNPWHAHGIIEIGKNLNVKAEGVKVILSGMTLHHFWQEGNRIETEKIEDKRMELKVSTGDQAKSWEETLAASSCTVGDKGGCCTIA